MPRIHLATHKFTADRAWGALELAQVEGASIKVHWTNAPYVWHVNDGAEVFAVIAGAVEMKYIEAGAETSVVLQAGDVFVADVGDSHVAHPMAEARILVVEKLGSV